MYNELLGIMMASKGKLHLKLFRRFLIVSECE